MVGQFSEPGKVLTASPFRKHNQRVHYLAVLCPKHGAEPGPSTHP